MIINTRLWCIGSCPDIPLVLYKLWKYIYKVFLGRSASNTRYEYVQEQANSPGNRRLACPSQRSIWFYLVRFWYIFRS